MARGVPAARPCAGGLLVGWTMANAQAGGATILWVDEVTGFNVLFWMLAFVIVCALLFATIWSLFTLTDLESDRINPMDACQTLNKMPKVEFIMLVRVAPFHVIYRHRGTCALPRAASSAFAASGSINWTDP